MNEADSVWMWFVIGITFTVFAMIELAFGTWDAFNDKPGLAFVSGAVGGAFGGLVSALAIKLWLDTKQSLPLERKQD